MQQNDKKSDSSPATPQSETAYPEELKAKARGFFAKAAEVAYTLNYDYAIELYLDGLSFWPNSVEEGHKPLMEIALRRQTSGGKKSGFGDSSKYKKVSGKNPRDAMLKNEYLMSKDPGNQSYMTGMIKAAIECEYKDTAIWMADILFEHNLHHDKPSFNTYIFLRDTYAGLEVYNRALQACQLAMQIKPKDANLQDSVRDLSAQTTLQQGRYDDDGDFRDSIKDRESQAKLQDQESLIRSVDVMKDAIEEARKEYDLEPTVPGKIDKFVATLCDTEEDENENVDMRASLDCLSMICDETEASAIICHHYNRAGQIRGASAIRDWTDNLLLMDIEERREGSVFLKMTHDKCRNYEQQPTFFLERTPDLQFLRCGVSKKYENVETVERVLREMGGTALNQAALKNAIMVELNCQEFKARKVIKTALEMRRILITPSRKEGGKGTPVTYVLP